MPKNVPLPIETKEIPPPGEEREKKPTGFTIQLPEEFKNRIPEEMQKKEEIPEESPVKEEIPEETSPKEEMPSDFKEENCVMVGDTKIEIKPTKLKYFRNKAASGYGIIKGVFKFCHPAKVIWTIVTSVDINMVGHIPVSDRIAMVSRAYDSMNTFLPDEHIACVRVEFAKGPLFVPFTRFPVVFTLTIDCAIISYIVSSSFVYADSLFGEIVDVRCFHGLIYYAFE